MTGGKSHILIIDIADAAIDICLCAKDVAVNKRSDGHSATLRPPMETHNVSFQFGMGLKRQLGLAMNLAGAMTETGASASAAVEEYR